MKELKEHWRSGLSAGVWIVSFFFAIWLFGFIISIPIFVISYMKSHGARWRAAILYGCVTLIVVYGIFDWALEIKLYRGLLLSG
jgi:Tripartite tricarboxylate transporter TctB family